MCVFNFLIISYILWLKMTSTGKNKKRQTKDKLCKSYGKSPLVHRKLQQINDTSLYTVAISESCDASPLSPFKPRIAINSHPKHHFCFTKWIGHFWTVVVYLITTEPEISSLLYNLWNSSNTGNSTRWASEVISQLPLFPTFQVCQENSLGKATMSLSPADYSNTQKFKARL